MSLFLLCCLLGGPVFAQGAVEAPDEGSFEDSVEDLDAPGMEIIVIDSVNIEKARAALGDKLSELGYRPSVRLGDRTIYLNAQIWKPTVVVYDWGGVKVKGRSVTPMAIVPSAISSQSQAAADNADVGAMVNVVGVVGSPRMARNQESRVLQELLPLVGDWNDAVAEQAVARRLEEVRQQAWAIWEQGVGPQGEALSDPGARRMALASLWLATADNAAGADVRAVVSDFIDQVVQGSAHPFTPEEVDQVNGKRGFEAELYPSGLGL